MPLPPATQPIAETDYEAIEAAVKETARGRWFLEEYAQRNRHADTRLVLEAIQRLQRSVLGADIAPAPAAQLAETQIERSESEHNAIERTAEHTRNLLAEIHAGRRRDGDLGDELDSIIAASAQAISGVLSDADRIAEISTTMRSQGIADYICDQLDGLSEHINTACAFQDLTGQRMQKVVLALRLLESRVRALVNLWHVESQAQNSNQTPARDELLNGPAREGEGLMQDQIDEILSIDQDHDVFWDERRSEAALQMQTAPQEAAPQHAETQTEIERLTPDERRALFS